MNVDVRSYVWQGEKRIGDGARNKKERRFIISLRMKDGGGAAARLLVGPRADEQTCGLYRPAYGSLSEHLQESLHHGRTAQNMQAVRKKRRRSSQQTTKVNPLPSLCDRLGTQPESTSKAIAHALCNELQRL